MQSSVFDGIVISANWLVWQVRRVADWRSHTTMTEIEALPLIVVMSLERFIFSRRAYRLWVTLFPFLYHCPLKKKKTGCDLRAGVGWLLWSMWPGSKTEWDLAIQLEENCEFFFFFFWKGRPFPLTFCLNFSFFFRSLEGNISIQMLFFPDGNVKWNQEIPVGINVICLLLL